MDAGKLLAPIAISNLSKGVTRTLTEKPLPHHQHHYQRGGYSPPWHRQQSDDCNSHLDQLTPVGSKEAKLPSGSARCKWNRGPLCWNRHRQHQRPGTSLPQCSHLHHKSAHWMVHPAMQKAAASSSGHEHPGNSHQGSLAWPCLHKKTGNGNLTLRHSSQHHCHGSSQ